MFAADSVPDPIGDSPGGAKIEWVAPAECPDEEALVEGVRALLPGRDVDASPSIVHASGTVEGSDGSFVLRLSIVTEAGRRTREMQSTKCSDLAAAAALLVAIALDPELVVGEPVEPEPEPQPEPIAEPDAGRAVASPSPSPAHQPVPPPEAFLSERDSKPRAQSSRIRPDLQGLVSIGTGASFAALPRTAPSLVARMGLRWRFLRVELGMVHRFRRTVPLPLMTAAYAELWNTVGKLSLCGVPAVRWVEFPLCAAVEAGSIAGRSRGVSSPAQGRGPWVASAFGGGVIARVHRNVALALHADAIVPITETRFEVAGVGEIFRSPAVGADVVFAIEFRFPSRKR